MNQINNSNNILYQDSIPFFTTILDLKSYNNYEQGDVVEVGGRKSIGDGYGSKFIYDSTSTAFVDDENVVLPSNLPLNSSGRWLINGWAFLNDKMEADNKILTGMTISSSTLTGSTITNSTLSNVTVPPTTDWTANTVVGALDINNKINNGLILKANLDGGNTLTGDQSITGNLSVVGSNTTNGTFQVLGKGNAPTNSKVLLSRSNTYSIVQSYDGSKWHYLSINDDGTVDTEKGNLAFQSDVDAKANLAGGNTLTGDQKVSSGNLIVSQTDSSATTITKSLDATTAGGILRYTDSSSTNHDWVFGKTSITTPSGDTISGAGNYAVKDADNNFTASQTINSGSLNIKNGSVYFTNPSGEQAQIYTDISGSGLSDYDLVFKTGTTPVYTSIGSDGRIFSSAKGDVLFTNVQNSLNQSMFINGGTGTPTNGASSQIIYQIPGGHYSRRDDVYFDGTNLWSRQMLYDNTTSTMVGYIQVDNSGYAYTNMAQLAFTTQLPFYGQNTSLRIQSFTTGTVSNETVISFPIAFTSIPQVYIQAIRDTDNVGITPMVNEITTTNFKYHGNDAQPLQVLAIGTY